jgi:hypothetical protein
MFVYLQGDPIKGIPTNHYVLVNPSQHLGVDAVPKDWVESTDGVAAGRCFPSILSTAGACPEDALAEYLCENGHAQKLPWEPSAKPWEW